MVLFIHEYSTSPHRRLNPSTDKPTAATNSRYLPPINSQPTDPIKAIQRWDPSDNLPTNVPGYMTTINLSPHALKIQYPQLLSFI